MPLEELWDAPVVTALLLPGQAHGLAALGEKLRPAAAGSFDLKQGAVLLGTPVRYYEMMPLDATKGAALRALRGQRALQGRTVLAAGDYWNDLELMQEADVAVAPANAIPEIRALSRFTVCSNDEGVIADIVERVIPQL